MLVDTSVWIAWLRGEESPATALLDRQLEEAAALLAPVILQELLQGARNERAYRELYRQFIDQPMLATSCATYALAGELYARCRWRGVTIRSPHDCLIAALALEHQMPLLTTDGDFRRIARIEPALRLIAVN